MYNRDDAVKVGGIFNNLGLEDKDDDALQQDILDLTMLVSDAQASIQARHAVMANREAARVEEAKRIAASLSPETNAIIEAGIRDWNTQQLNLDERLADSILVNHIDD